jgi:predicted nuclease of predicted toxin-antitoxin system
MKVKLDENIPFAFKSLLSALGHEVDTTADEGLNGKSDVAVWEASKKEGRFLVTQDLDFSDVRSFAPGTHSGILVIRLREPSRLRLIKRMAELVDREMVDDWQGCLIVVTDHKIRIKKPVQF